MKQRFIQLINRLATGRNFIMMIIVWLSYAMLVMDPSGSSSPNNIGPIDLTFAVSPTVICNMIEAYGEAFRQDYIWAAIIWDSIYPLIYGLTMLLGFSYGMSRAGINSAYKDNLLLLPLLVVGADYSENIGIVTLLSTYPSCSLDVASFVTILVTVKWVMAILCLILLIVVFFLFLYRKLQSHINP